MVPLPDSVGIPKVWLYSILTDPDIRQGRIGDPADARLPSNGREPLTGSASPFHVLTLRTLTLQRRYLIKRDKCPLFSKRLLGALLAPRPHDSQLYITIPRRSNPRLALVLCVHQGLSIVLSSQAPSCFPTAVRHRDRKYKKTRF